MTATDDRRGAIAGVFGRAATSYDSVIPFFGTFGRLLAEAARLEPGDDILDVAAGRGASLFSAAEMVGPKGRAVGVDLSPQIVSQLQADVTARGLSNVEIRRMDARELDLADQSFDRLLCGFTLWLLDDADRSAAEFFRVLRQGGRCVVSTPRQGGPGWDFFRPLVTSFSNRATRAVPSRAACDIDVVGLLSASGFRLIEVTE